MTATVVPNRTDLNDEIADVLQDATLQPTDCGQVPELDEDRDFDDQGRLRSAYTIVYALPGIVSHGKLNDQRWMARYTYQLTSVGQTDEQAQWMADRNRQALLARTGSAYTHPIETDDVRVRLIVPTMLGGPEESGGGLRQVVDHYDMEVVSIG